VIGRSDVHLLYAARAARGVGDGFAIIILPAYLSQLGFGPFQIGLVASATLVCTENLNPEVVVMESADDGERF
jgi:hypothetical protein